MGVDGAGGLASDDRSHYIANRDSLGAFLLSLALRRRRIGGFTGLRDHHRKGILADDRITISEFTAVIDFHGNAGGPLDHELAGQRGVPTGAAGNDSNMAETGKLGGRDIHFVQENAAGFLPDPAERGIADGARLLKDLLEHEVLVAALFGL